jgi:hypothetical protein
VTTAEVEFVQDTETVVAAETVPTTVVAAAGRVVPLVALEMVESPATLVATSW